MARASALPSWQRAVIALAGTTIAAVVVTFLYWAQAVLIPVALAVFLSFVLAPLVGLLRRFRVGRVTSVILAVLISLSIILGLGAVIGTQCEVAPDRHPTREPGRAPGRKRQGGRHAQDFVSGRRGDHATGTARGHRQKARHDATSNQVGAIST